MLSGGRRGALSSAALWAPPVPQFPCGVPVSHCHHPAPSLTGRNWGVLYGHNKVAVFEPACNYQLTDFFFKGSEQRGVTAWAGCTGSVTHVLLCNQREHGELHALQAGCRPCF